MSEATCPEYNLCQQLSCLYFIAAKFDMTLSAVHLAGSANGLTDALSRNHLAKFLANYPQANPLSIAYSSTASPPPDLLSARLGISILEQNVQFNLRSAISNTMRSYTCSHRRYLNFCSQLRISQPYPTSESILCQFTGYLGRQRLKY